VTEHVREKFSCRSCETITQPPAPFHAIARGFAGPSLLAMILVDKYANHQPLNRHSVPSSSAIATAFNARCVAAPNGGQWFPTQVRRVRDRLGL